MRCRASDEKRDAATGPKNPAFGGPGRLIGCVAAIARHLGLRGTRIAPRPGRMVEAAARRGGFPISGVSRRPAMPLFTAAVAP